MMLFTEDQEMILDAANGHLERNAPVSTFRKLRDENQDAYSENLWTSLVEMGWSAILIPDEFDGLGFSAVEAGIVAQELGKRLTVSPFISSAVLSTVAITNSDNETLKARLLPALAAGETKAAFACDQGSRHDTSLPGIACEVESSDDGFTVSTTIGIVDGMASADNLIAYLSIDGEAVLACIDTTAEGIGFEALRMIDARSAARVTLNSVKLSENDILARGEDARSAASAAVTYGRAVLAAEMVGCASQALHLTVEYLKERKQFGVPVGSFQALQHRCAILHTEVELAKSIVSSALAALATGSSDAEKLVVAAKSKANDAAILAAQEGVQLHGGIGMTDEHDIGLFLKRIRTASLTLGDSHQMKSLFATLRGY